MIPNGSQAVDHLAGRMAADLIPKAADAYMMADLAILTGLVKMVGQDFDRAAEVLVSDLDALRAIFREAHQHVADQPLQQRMAAIASGYTKSLAIPVLNRDADMAMRVLIELHASVEEAVEMGAAWAPTLDSRIWGFLDDYVAKRVYTGTLI